MLFSVLYYIKSSLREQYFLPVLRNPFRVFNLYFTANALLRSNNIEFSIPVLRTDSAGYTPSFFPGPQNQD